MADGLLLGLRVALSLALVLAVLWFAARQVGTRTGATRRVPVTVLGRQALGRRAGVAVVEVAGRTLVVGVSDAGVRLLTELDAADRPALALTGPEAEAAVITGRFPARPDGFAAVLAAQGGTQPPGEISPAPTRGGRGRRRAEPAGPLAGSVLHPATWTRAWEALHGRRTGTR